MAIQVNGTTVIDNSRNLQNVQGIKTVGGQSILGSGNISISSGLTDLAGGKTSGTLPSFGNAVPVGGVVIVDSDASTISSSVGGYASLIYWAEYGKSYTMNGNNYNYNHLTGYSSSGSGSRNTVVINSGTWQIIPICEKTGPGSVICLRVS